MSKVRKRKEEDYEEYMTGIPSAAPAITGALREHGERRVNESENRQEKEPQKREGAAVEASVKPRAEELAKHAIKREEKVVGAAVKPAKEQGAAAVERAVAAATVTEAAVIETAVEPGAAVVAESEAIAAVTAAESEAAKGAGRRAKLVREIALPQYAAGGRRAAEDLAGKAPVRQSVTLAPSQVQRLQREVQRRKRAGKRADLSSLCRELIERLRSGAGEGASAGSHGDARFVAQTLYLSEAQVQWLVAEVLRRRERREGADKSSLIREAIELGFASDSSVKKT